jgi:hypothetical protein
MHVLKLAVFLFVASFSTIALGQTPEVSINTQTATETPTLWYGWQTLLTDAGALSLLVVGTSLDLRQATLVHAIQITGASSYLLGAPTVHWLHGHPSKALESVGLRLAAPAASGLLGYGIGALACGKNDDSDASCPAVLGGVGLALGFGAAIAIDAAVLAREPSGPEVSQSSQSVFALIPSLEYDHGGWRAGLSGTF